MDSNRILISLGSNLGEFGSNDKGYYWKLPNGLIFQWGDNTGQQSQYSKKIYSFPIPYKSNVFMIATEPKGYIGVQANKTAHSASVENLKQFSLYVGEYRNMYWFAIGN